jgi:hypothetical protein
MNRAGKVTDRVAGVSLFGGDPGDGLIPGGDGRVCGGDPGDPHRGVPASLTMAADAAGDWADVGSRQFNPAL